MGNAFGESKTVQGDVKVWQPQQQYLKYGMGQAQDIYDKSKGSNFFSGDMYAGLDPAMRAKIMGGAEANNTAAQAGAGSLAGAGQSFLGASGQTLESLMKSVNDPNGAMNMGTAYANSDAATGLVNNAALDINRGLTENDLPAARLAAIGSGNGGSSRLGAREAILERGAADRLGSMSNQIRGSFFNEGTNQYNTDNAMKSQLVSGLNQMGAGNLQAGNSLSQSGTDGIAQAAGIGQQDDQGGLDAALKQWLGNDTRASDLLSRMWGVVGGNIGQTPGITSQNTPGWFSQVFPKGIMG